MILVDTSIWVRKLRGRQPWADQMDDQIRRFNVVGHPMVFGELLLGNRSEGLLERYAVIPWLPVASHDGVVAMVRARRLSGMGLGWVDSHLLASSLASGTPLWTADNAMAEAARRLGISWAADY
ncbi:MAG TPA: type II toxin-antitoxin system VapC family toxin [Terriglobales bacterium]|nr:type II toxin-antitoxin system VapC family toxin [Terriglobales bacterium]